MGIVLTFLSPGLIGLAKTDSPTLAAPPSFCSISATPAASIQPKKMAITLKPRSMDKPERGAGVQRSLVRAELVAWCYG